MAALQASPADLRSLSWLGNLAPRVGRLALRSLPEAEGMKIDTRERRRCDECGRRFIVRPAQEDAMRTSCMRCMGFTPRAIRDLAHLDSPPKFDRWDR